MSGSVCLRGQNAVLSENDRVEFAFGSRSGWLWGRVAPMKPALHQHLPFTPWDDPVLRKLPGMKPGVVRDGFVSDEAFAAQMAQRDHLITTRPADVMACLPEAQAPASELLDLGLSQIGLSRDYTQATRADGKVVSIDRDAPLRTLGQLFQADFCILQKPEGASEHVLTGAVLCFPAGWTLAEKIGRPLVRVHRPVASYDDGLAPRVQRLFDGLRAGQALWRAIAHLHETPDLFTPRLERDPRPEDHAHAPFIRAERQVLFRLAGSKAVVFSIHSYMIARTNLSPAQTTSLAKAALLPG